MKIFLFVRALRCACLFFRENAILRVGAGKGYLHAAELLRLNYSKYVFAVKRSVLIVRGRNCASWEILFACINWAQRGKFLRSNIFLMSDAILPSINFKQVGTGSLSCLRGVNCKFLFFDVCLCLELPDRRKNRFCSLGAEI